MQSTEFVKDGQRIAKVQKTFSQRVSEKRTCFRKFYSTVISWILSLYNATFLRTYADRIKRRDIPTRVLSAENFPLEKTNLQNEP